MKKEPGMPCQSRTSIPPTFYWLEYNIEETGVEFNLESIYNVLNSRGIYMKKSFGKYQIIRELGKGAMGVVYLAFDPVLEREVAIKTISTAQTDTDIKERFIREARSAGKLRHNNIITIYDFGEEEGQLFIAMELLDGKDLDEIIASKPQMELTDKLEIIRQICLGLDYAHRHHIYHRDIKPANIKVLPDGTIKIMDFGLATMQTSSLTKTGTVMGTPHYMSPEMVSGGQVDGRSDQFAVGVVLYEFLTYTRPFTGDNISTILYKILNEDPKTFDAGLLARYPELKRITETSLKKSLEQRYPTMKQMAEDIKKLQHKILTQGFKMDDATMVIGDDMETILMETELDYDALKKERGKKKIPILPIAAAFILIAATAFYFLVLQKAPPTVINNGFLLVDIKPYVEISNVTNLDTGKVISLGENEKVTPCRISLLPGRYRISYNHSSFDGVERKKDLTIESGKEFRLGDSLSTEYLKDAIEHFKVYK
jgi:serine/threonine protein kinase